MNYTRTKSLSKSFSPTRFDENDLYRLARIVEAAAKKSNEQPLFVVTTADQKETFKSKTSEFFLSADMPVHISTVKMEFGSYGADVAGAITLDSYNGRQAKLAVSGKDPNLVSGLFDDISREVRFRVSPYAWAIVTLYSGWSTLVFSVLASSAFYAIFDLFKRALLHGAPQEHVETLDRIALLVALLILLVGGQGISASLRERFPCVEFVGRLRDPTHDKRGLLVIVLGVFFVPALGNFMFELIKFLGSRAFI